MQYDPHSAGDSLKAVEILLFVSMTISSAQQLRMADAYGRGGLFSWRIQKYAYQVKVFERPVFDLLSGRTGFTLLHLLRISLMAMAVAFNAPPLTMTGVLVVSGILHLRAFMAMTAADQLSMIILFCLVVCAWHPTPDLQALSLWVIAIQVLVCYWCNGLMKALDRTWRDGTGLRGILLTEDYSRKIVARMIENKRINWSRLLSFVVFGWELGAIAAPFLPAPGLRVYLGLGVLFHLVVALVMGLNTFFYTFLSTYPAILYLNSRVFPVAWNWLIG